MRTCLHGNTCESDEKYCQSTKGPFPEVWEISDHNMSKGLGLLNTQRCIFGGFCILCLDSLIVFVEELFNFLSIIVRFSFKLSFFQNLSMCSHDI